MSKQLQWWILVQQVQTLENSHKSWWKFYWIARLFEESCSYFLNNSSFITQKVQFWNAHSQDCGLFSVVGLHIMPFFCVSSSRSDAQLCSNHRAHATRQCDSFRASATSQGVLWLSQSCCVTSQSCSATSQGSRDVTLLLQDYLSHNPQSCSGCCETVSYSTCLSPAPVFEVISPLCKIV